MKVNLGELLFVFALGALISWFFTYRSWQIERQTEDKFCETRIYMGVEMIRCEEKQELESMQRNWILE